ncbi:monocarboxylate transporter 5 [Chironomus tepperi]|uniref:monocarboxylate transporter 5 n=1 Tax=Chironomus tepperi TaxID=113505 RepID=UPI00391FC1E7
MADNDASTPKSGNEVPKNGNTNKNKQGLKLEILKKPEEVEPTVTSATIIIPPDGGFAWIVMIASFCCNLIVDGIVFSFGMFIENIQEDLKVSTAQVALVGSLLSGFYLIVGPFVSALTNRYGFRLVTIFGSLIASLAFALCFNVHDIFYLYILYGVFGGIGFCFIYMPSVIIVGYYFEKWRPLATGIALCGSGVGTFVMGPISTKLVEKYQWRGALLIQAGMILLCSVFALAYRPIEPTIVSDVKDDEVPEKKSLIGDSFQSPAFTKPLPEGRFAYSVPNSSHNTWMGTANNTTYPTAAEIFRGSGVNLERRPSQNFDKLTQINISSTTKKLEQIKQGQKRSGHATPTEDFTHPPHVLSLNAHELGPVGEAEEAEENENGTLLEKNEVKVAVVSSSSGRRHTVSGRKGGTESQTNSRRGSRQDISRPMYRDDIFFSGSLAKLPQYRSQTSLGYHLSVTHMPTQRDIEEEENHNSKCTICPEAVRRTLSTMLDVSLLKNYSFILLALSGFFTMLGFFVPFMYIANRAKQFKIHKDTAILFLSALGVFNTIARIVCGWLSSFEGISALYLNNIFITAGGLATMFSGYFMSIPAQYVYTAIFGIACACFSALRSIIVVELLGLEKLTNAFGILLLFQGIAAIFGSPLAGYLFQVTEKYDLPFMVAGGLITFSAVLCYPLNIIKNWQNAGNQRKVAASA